MKNELIEISSEDNNHWHSKTTYMVNFMGDLLLIYRFRELIDYIEGNNDMDDADDDFDHDNNNSVVRNYYHNRTYTVTKFCTRRFMLFKLDQKENQFIELKSINSHVMFFGL